jgi:hypothetical protein
MENYKCSTIFVVEFVISLDMLHPVTATFVYIYVYIRCDRFLSSEWL